MIPDLYFNTASASDNPLNRLGVPRGMLGVQDLLADISRIHQINPAAYVVIVVPRLVSFCAQSVHLRNVCESIPAEFREKVFFLAERFTYHDDRIVSRDFASHQYGKIPLF